MRQVLPILILSTVATLTGSRGGRAEYVGGTISQIPDGCSGQLDSVDEQYFVFYSKGASWRVSYEQINLVEYGQKVDRRYMAAIVISPLFLLSKKRQHFLTLGYTDEEGRQQAMVFKVNKDDIRFLLVSLEARTGRKVQFQDDEARKAGKS